MGKAALLIIAASLAMGSMYSLAAKDDARQAEARLSKHQYEVLARNAALAGYNRAKQALADNFDAAPAQLKGTYAGTDYNVSITRDGDVATISAKGVATAADGTDVDFQIKSSIRKELSVDIADIAPPFMRYAVITDKDLQLNGNILMDLYVDGNEDNTLNANMHTNGMLTIKGMAATVRGFGTYVTGASGSPATALTKTFNPYSNPTNEPVSRQASKIEIPEFDAAKFLSKVNVDKSSTGEVQLSGTYNLPGTRENPFVWHINGDLSASGGVQINGYALFIVEGDITLSGNFRGSSTYTGSDESNIALYASGKVTMSGNADLYGQIYSEGGVELKGTPRVYGSITSKGTVTLSGTPDILYRKASPALTTIFEDPEVYYNQVAYSEW